MLLPGHGRELAISFSFRLFRTTLTFSLPSAHFKKEKVSFLILILVPFNAVASQIVYFVRCRYEKLSAVVTILIFFRPVRSQIVARTFLVITLCVCRVLPVHIYIPLLPARSVYTCRVPKNFPLRLTHGGKKLVRE